MAQEKVKDRLEELKAEYVRLQQDLEKVESLSHNMSPLEKQLISLEEEINELNSLLRSSK
ncbi:SE1832 family protein [Alkalihalobacillus trypoxylicola]|uniref:Uncharacterized protein n=1 Tax=Alkalihalobacillus trypoxylicola TaxID=519424 RepID=A0A161PLH8_9BACI|nr:SE1832 family protein [Alkalihalobacillus trypoxylicola]KYG34783.1 hypothetical protein AZF04_00155 [Alkalihalobacillus trypoxylicola]